MKLLLCSLFSLVLWISISISPHSIDVMPSAFQEEALEILRNKCNVCHVKKNPSKVFDFENMNVFAKRIHRQVFVWKRMPKGNSITLTKKEKDTLKKWINSLKK